MLQLKTEQAGVDVSTVLPGLGSYTERLAAIRKGGVYDDPESSINLSGDEELLDQVQSLISTKVTPRLKYSIVVGIGGSNLGTKAVYDAMLGYRDLMEPQRFPKMLFAETTDPEWLAALGGLLRTLDGPDEVLISVISKSGGTTETLANFEIIMQTLTEKFGDATGRVVAITDDGSKLADAADQRSIARLMIPAPVGGRYSVLSAVGLFPLASVGIDIVRLREGARLLLDTCLSGENPTAVSAAVLSEQLKHGYHINDNFFFHPELESLGKWYRQLMGESVGKEESLDGQVVHAGITPTVSLGSTDLHSVGQLYLGGPKDKLTTFVSSSTSKEISVPSERLIPELVPMINDRSASDIMKSILEGVKVAYQKAGLPYMEVTLDAIDERSLGAFLQFKMLEMMYLGALLNVNSFDQPNVEAYKVETKRLLEA
jgi:glucose-6-phosphate isomerase